MSALFRGMAKLLDVFGILSRQEMEPILTKSDAKALQDDGEALAEDLFTIDWVLMFRWGDLPIPYDARPMEGRDEQTE